MTDKKTLTAVFCAVAAAAGYSLVPTLAGKAVQRMKPKKQGEEKVIYLTFDDGPDPRWTGRLLDLLAACGIRASFFVVADAARENPALIRRMKEEGHLIGLHSLDHHSDMIKSPLRTVREFEESLKIMEQLDAGTDYYRPPWGHVNLWTLYCLRRFGLKKVMWDVMAQDWEEDISEEEIQYRLLKRTGEGDIICLHDGRGWGDAPGRMLDALEKTIPLWIEDGFSFRRADEI
ncbi:MAG: polysaccharide deacetylase family protein [Emergencia sp.]